MSRFLPPSERQWTHPDPINTYKGWQGLGRQVKRGEKALVLCMPIHAKRKSEDEESDEEREILRFFVYRRNWFILSQTDGADMPELEVGSVEPRALRFMKLVRLPEIVPSDESAIEQFFGDAHTRVGRLVPLFQTKPGES